MGGSDVRLATVVVYVRQVGRRCRARIGVTAAPRSGWPFQPRSENEALVPRHSHCRQGRTVPRQRALRAGLIPACPQVSFRQRCKILDFPAADGGMARQERLACRWRRLLRRRARGVVVSQD